VVRFRRAGHAVRFRLSAVRLLHAVAPGTYLWIESISICLFASLLQSIQIDHIKGVDSIALQPKNSRLSYVPYHEAKSVQNVGRRHFKVNVIATSVEGSESIKC